MVKPYCEHCGKHRGSCNGYCCDAEAKRAAPGFFDFMLLVCVIIFLLKMLAD